MSVIRWQDGFLTGVAKIDADHKMIVTLSDQLADALDEGQARDVIDSILHVLVENLLKHMDREERLMSEAGFAGLPDRRDQRRRAQDRLDALLAAYAIKPAAAMEDLMTWLKNWLVDHIGNSDTHAWLTAWRRGLAPRSI